MPVEAFETQAPGHRAAAADITAANNSARLLLDDGYSVRVDNAAHPGDQPYFTKDVVVRNGDAVNFPAGGSLLSFDFSNWRLQPPVPVTDASAGEPEADVHDRGNPRPATAPAVGGDITVAAFNVLNYFTTLTSQNPDARGAATAAGVRHPEVEDRHGDQRPGRRRRRAAGDRELGQARRGARRGARRPRRRAQRRGRVDGTWDYVRTPAALHDAAITDFITNAIIYKPAVVKPSGEAQTVIDETVWDIAREPIAQTFKYGKQFVTVVGNHFKSKSRAPTRRRQPGQDAFNDERVDAGASRCSPSRTASRTDRKNDVYLVGDFNSYAQGGPDQGLHRRGLDRPAVHEGAAASTPTPSTASSARSTT